MTSSFFQAFQEDNEGGRIPIHQLLRYLNEPPIPARANVPADRPYCWLNSVTSLDGILSFAEEKAQGPHEIALRHRDEPGAHCDFRQLNASWAMADAVLLSGAILRAEPRVCCYPQFEDLKAFRLEQLGFGSIYPLQIVLTQSLDIYDLVPQHVLFQDPDVRVLIATTNTVLCQKPRHDATLVHKCQLSWQAFGQESVDICALFRCLRQEWDVHWLDVSCGGRVFAKLIQHQLVDELRLTTTTQLCGPVNCLGETRPSLFSSLPSYAHSSNPMFEYTNLRTFGRQFLFARMRRVQQRPP